MNTLWRAHPINAPITLKAGETGPIELTFFLNKKLSKTNIGTIGKFRVDIFTALPLPQSGVIRCYFYSSIVAKECELSNKIDAAGQDEDTDLLSPFFIIMLDI